MSIFFPFPLPLTPKQWSYIAGTQCLVAGIIDGGANFGIAYAMYGQQTDVKMWVFSQNTIAGDLGVTPIIQTAVSMIITSTLVHTDLHHSMIKPLAFVWPHVEHLPNPHRLFKRSKSVDIEESRSETSSDKPRSTLGYYWGMLMRFIFEGTENNMLFEQGIKGFPKRLAWTALQGVGLGIVMGFPVWCLFIVILGPIYKMDNMGNRWDPQIIKGVYGFLLGIITNPIIAMLALGSQAEHNLMVQRVEEAGAKEAADADQETQERLATPPPVVSTPRISRLRSGSYASSIRQAGLTANVNDMPLESPVRLGPIVQPPSTPQTPGSMVPRRPRALTGASETGSYYSLGGTGGRAQRGRRPSQASVLGTPQPQDMRGRQRTMTESTVSPARQIPLAWMQDGGDVVPGTPHRQHTGMSRLMAESRLDAPRESMEARGDGDVFDK